MIINIDLIRWDEKSLLTIAVNSNLTWWVILKINNMLHRLNDANIAQKQSVKFNYE